ncbi:MAG: L-fuculokinase, partial [Candidatus Atribacteria bacterium]|nr:L-fuculokinase [Candidatus Atribacteria bacterium]MCD6350036.1 L-fuculokinase [Candidatus Atribacteria bacterium]
MQTPYFLILDCGATSLRAVAISEEGKILSIASFANSPRPQKENPQFLIWDIEEMWDVFCKAIRKVIGEVGKEVRAVAVTT